MTLTELATKYHCDKLSNHSYIPVYEKLFSDFPGGVGRFLEIGIGYRELMEPFVDEYVHGASIWMWRDYFPDAGIFACDIREETLIEEPERLIWSMQCDQTKPSDLWRLIKWSGGAFDIVIDDGSHEPESQILTAAVLLPHIRNHGIYIVEDCREPQRVADAIGGEAMILGKRPDDNLVIVRR